MLIVNILLAVFVIKGDPRHFGLKPYGFLETKEEGDDTQPPALSEGHTMDLGLRKAGMHPMTCFL